MASMIFKRMKQKMLPLITKIQTIIAIIPIRLETNFLKNIKFKAKILNQPKEKKCDVLVIDNKVQYILSKIFQKSKIR
jgi:hypothetical protein